ncbi:ABC transporter permease [Clostridium sp. UBA3887]|uniref:ABC transporter permease n=1 Tax=Clostridium sp. UBA3887 TaxID=1946356 RepID=UPI00321778D0
MLRKILMLSFANIKKTKGHTVSILFMFIIAAMLLNLGLLVFVNFGSYFEKVTEELNSSDEYYLMPESLYSQRVSEYIKSNDDIKRSQKVSSLLAKGTIPYNNDNREFNFLINDVDQKRDFSKWEFVGEHESPDSMSIYLPYVMNIDGGYKVNDKLKVSFEDVDMTFTIKGFTEDIFFSSLDTVVMGVYLPSDTYDRVVEKLGVKYKASLIFADLRKNNMDVENGIKEIIKEENPNILTDDVSIFFSLDKGVVRLSRSIMANIVSVMMMVFAAIIVVVCLIVVRFRIENSIEEDMTKIGSLKAVGYTSRQIISSITIQFSLIALVGSMMGITLSYLATPAISKVFAHQSGLMWVQGFDGMISSISLFVILLVVILVSFISSSRINRLNPIVALRGGIITHSFRKNYMPLHKSRGSLPFVLSIKLMLQNMKQSLMIGMIFLVVSFAGTFALSMFYNSVIDTKIFKEIPGVELSSVIAVCNPIVDNTSVVENIKNMKGVRKAQFLDIVMMNSDSYEVATYVMDDYSMKETNTIYEGRYPLHSNEVAISGYLAERVKKNIGDSIILKVNDKQSEYIITGYCQGSYMGKFNIAYIRSDGILSLNQEFKQRDLQIYLDKDIKSSEFKMEIDKLYGDDFLKVVDLDKEVQQGIGLYTGIISKVGISILVVTIFVVMLVLYFVINSSVIRKKHDLGIQKALGFTTLQLMHQLSMGFLPPIITGVCLGSLLGMTQTNAIMAVPMKAMGLMKVNFIVTPLWSMLFDVGIVIVSYAISMLVTYRIRKITAYGLVSE